MEYRFTPRGVCTRQILLDVEDGIVKKVNFLGGCAGNTQGVAALVIGMRAEDAIAKIKGIKCGFKPTHYL